MNKYLNFDTVTEKHLYFKLLDHGQNLKKKHSRLLEITTYFLSIATKRLFNWGTQYITESLRALN